MDSAWRLLYGPRPQGPGPQPLVAGPPSWPQFARDVVNSLANHPILDFDPDFLIIDSEAGRDVAHVIFDLPIPEHQYLRLIAVNEQGCYGVAIHPGEQGHSFPAPHVIKPYPPYSYHPLGLLDIFVHFQREAEALQLDFIDVSLPAHAIADRFTSDDQIEFFSGSWDEPCRNGFAGEVAKQLAEDYLSRLPLDKDAQQNRLDCLDLTAQLNTTIAFGDGSESALRILLANPFGFEALKSQNAVLIRQRFDG